MPGAAHTLVDGRMLGRLGRFYPTGVAIQQATETRDATGSVKSSWAVVGGMEALKGYVAAVATATEQRRADVTAVQATFAIELASYQPLITTKMRAVVGAATYNILAVQHDSQQKTTHLLAQVVTT